MKRVRNGFRVVLLAGLCLVAGAVIAYAVSQSMLVVDSSRSRTLDRLADEGMELVHLTHAVLQYPGPRTIDQWQAQFDEVRTLIAANAKPMDAEAAALLERVGVRLGVLGSLQEKLAEARDKTAFGERSATVSAILSAQLFQEATQLQASLKAVHTASNASLQAAYEQARRRQIGIFVLFAVACVAFGVVVSMGFRLRILEPLSALEQAIHAIGRGQERRAPVLVADEIGIICTAFNDLLDRQRAAESRLRASEERFRALIEHAPDAIVVFDAGMGKFVDANPGAEKLFGCAREELLQAGPERFYRDDADSSDIRDRNARALAGEAVEFTASIRAADARNLVCEVRLTRLPGEQGASIRASFLDVTEREQAKRDLLRLNQELEQRVAERTAQLQAANQELEAFSYSVSHDLRAPLRAINGFAEALKEDCAERLDANGRRHLDAVRRNALHMNTLIDDILRFSRMAHTEMCVAAVDMTTLAQEVFDEVRGIVPERHIALRLGALPTTQGDPSMIRQILVNLLSNAVKFSAGKDEAIIEVGGRVEGGENIYWVKDNGAGFDMQYAGKLFGVFQRLHDMRDFEGTGLGLAIVKRVADRHGGRAWAEGRVGEGATLYFALPVRAS